MSRLNSSYEDAIVQWAYAVLGIPVMWDFQDAPSTGRGPRRKQIKLPYATVGYVVGPRSSSFQYDLSYKEATTFTYKFYKDFTIAINIYAKESHMSLMESLINSVHLPTKKAVLREAGLSFWGNTDPLDLSELLDTKSQLRVVSDFDFAYRTDVEDATGLIEVVNIDGELDDITIDMTVKEDAPTMQFDNSSNSQYIPII